MANTKAKQPETINQDSAVNVTVEATSAQRNNGVSAAEVTAVLREIYREYVISRGKFEKFHSLHEAYAVLLEEVKEVELITFSKAPRRGNAKLKSELIQVAAMAVAAIIECS